jgi:hypothetical protein
MSRSERPWCSRAQSLASGPARRRAGHYPTLVGRQRAPRAHGDHSSGARGGGIDKSVLSLSEVRRYRDKAHLQFVASWPCLVCGRTPCDPHHLRFAQVRALGRRVSDEFTVPLCRLHHREVHRLRNESDWWKRLGIDALATALRLWKMTRSNHPPGPDTAAPAGPRVDAAPERTQARRRAQKLPKPKPAAIPSRSA